MINRNEIIEYLQRFSMEKPYVYAMWLEGADGLGRVDEYSDIDFWFDVEKSYQEPFLWECLETLNKLSPIDSRVDEIRAEIAQSNIHLENTSEYLTLDICVQSHEIRGKEMTCYTRDDIAELPFVLFDKKDIISFTEYDIDVIKIKKALEKNKNKLRQMSRVVKYIKRGQYLETYMKYLENVAEPLVEMARLIYTPRNYEYGLCHISQHLPIETVRELEQFYRVTCLQDMEENLPKAERLFAEYENRLRKMYCLKT
ncbi:MAG: hypothetical protein NC314_01540 [Roseburia sp.]|nr:hypothetical protein [Roseburia sp.]MCM1241497.1 hypothetical protein [Roseburia sp.]